MMDLLKIDGKLLRQQLRTLGALGFRYGMDPGEREDLMGLWNLGHALLDEKDNPELRIAVLG